MRRIALSAALIGLLSASLMAQTSKNWELRPDRSWEEINRSAPQPEADPDLNRAQTMLIQGKFDSAKKILFRWVKNPATRAHPQRDRALLLTAEALFQYGDRIKSFYYCDQLLDEYPDSRYYAVALQKQYEIGDAFLDGYKLRFMKIPFLDAVEYGVELMFRIQQRSPGSELAERALLRTADHYFNDAQYDLSSDAYASYIKAYPRSPVIPRVRLQRAYSSYAQFRGVRYDVTPLLEARSQFLDLESEYPQLAAEHNLSSLVERIDQAFAQKIAWTADFYRRTSQPRAAVYQYRFLALTYPESTEAKTASAQLARMPEKYLSEPAPRAGTGYAPTTVPTEEVSQ